MLELAQFGGKKLSQISLCAISQLNSTKAKESFSKMDVEQNSEFEEEEEKATNLVKSASKNLKDVKKKVLRKEKEAEKNLEKVKTDGLEEIKKAKLKLKSASAYKTALNLKKRSLGLAPEPEKVGFFH